MSNIRNLVSDALVGRQRFTLSWLWKKVGVWPNSQDGRAVLDDIAARVDAGEVDLDGVDGYIITDTGRRALVEAE